MNTPPDDALWTRLVHHRIADLGGPGAFSAKLRRQQNWTPSYCARAIEDYRRFCYLSVRSETPCSPSPDVDAVWHLHLTHTRDYWQRFCPEVLGKSLHHDPAKSGASERGALVQQYAQTLIAYQSAFGEPPAEDLWPTFAEQEQCARSQRIVDLRRYWLVPRPRAWLKRWWFVLGSASPGSAAALDANPLQWPGPEFLLLFGVLMVVVAVIRAGIERKRRDLGPMLPGAELAPEAVALLAGGAQRVVDLVANTLVERQSLLVESGRLGTVLGASGRSPLEAALLSVCAVPRRPSELQALLAPQLRDLESTLERRGLWLTTEQMVGARWSQVWWVGALWLFGAAKIGIGLQSGRPVLWLVLMMVLVSLSLLRVLLDSDRRSASGAAQLRDWKRRHATLARASTEGDRPLAAALFGLGALAAAGAASAYVLIRQPAASAAAVGDSSGSGCTSAGSGTAGSDSGGSGCSSGCGGCGGGGGD